MSHFDSWENDFDKTVKRGFWAFFGVWALIVLFNIVFWAVAIWAIVKLVNHYA